MVQLQVDNISYTKVTAKVGKLIRALVLTGLAIEVVTAIIFVCGISQSTCIIIMYGTAAVVPLGGTLSLARARYDGIHEIARYQDLMSALNISAGCIGIYHGSLAVYSRIQGFCLESTTVNFAWLITGLILLVVGVWAAHR